MADGEEEKEEGSETSGSSGRQKQKGQGKGEEEMTPLNGYDISRETFSRLSTDAKLDILFDMVQSFHDCHIVECRLRGDKCNTRFDNIGQEIRDMAEQTRKSQRLNRAIITLAALLGGMVGSLVNYVK